MFIFFCIGLIYSKTIFYSDFESGWEDQWKSSEAIKKDSSSQDRELLAYTGKWDVKAANKNALPKDHGLVTLNAAKHYAISAQFENELSYKNKFITLQYDLKLQNGLECGGAYLKFLSTSLNHKEFDNTTPFSIMFGPDKCGSTDKVHFIINTKKDKNAKAVEHQLKTNIPAKIDSDYTHVYTLIVDLEKQEFEILIDGVSGQKGNLLNDFTPSTQPPEEIPDPKDKKPSDWVDEEFIPDPDATKPDDWDEDEPRLIPDEDAKMPDDWLEDEELMISETDEAPEDWDTEEDGEFVAPQIPNPKCEKVSGCGKWTPPQKPNPKYKGPWTRPQKKNPEYKGVWKPKNIANPDYYKVENVFDFVANIKGVGIEIWTMQSDILFDNIFVASGKEGIEEASKLREKTWAKKHQLEEASKKTEEKTPEPSSSEDENESEEDEELKDEL